jgi:hypothetical protein
VHAWRVDAAFGPCRSVSGDKHSRKMLHHPLSVTWWKRSAMSMFLLGAAGGGRGRGSTWPVGTAYCQGSTAAVADPGAALQGRPPTFRV